MNKSNLTRETQEALDRLKGGNRRFVSGEADIRDLTCPERRKEVSKSQKPFAIILGCSDSRAPAEVLFDHGLGDLFVIRVAGNVVSKTQIGSIEFAAQEFGARLVVVLGHSNCGAIGAAILELERQLDEPSENIHSIVDRIVPAIKPVFEQNHIRENPEELYRESVRANVRASVEQLKTGSQKLESLIEKDGMRIVGAEYSLDTGIVEFL